MVHFKWHLVCSSYNLNECYHDCFSQCVLSEGLFVMKNFMKKNLHLSPYGKFKNDIQTNIGHVWQMEKKVKIYSMFNALSAH